MNAIDTHPLLALAVGVPLACAALVAALRERVPGGVVQAITIATPCAVLAVLAVAIVDVDAHGSFQAWLGDWTPRHGLALGIALEADWFTLIAASFAAFVVLASAIYATGHFEEVRGMFHTLLLLLLAGLEGFALAGDLFTQFVFFELMGMASFALTALHADERGPVQGSMTFTVTNGLAGSLFLFGIALVYARTGALNMAQLHDALAHIGPEPLVVASFALISVALLIKAANVPFHFWLGDAHATAPAPVSAVFSGVMVPLAAVMIARDDCDVFRGALAAIEPSVRATFLAIGSVTVVVAGFACVLQRHLKRLLAFSTVAHMGVVVAGVGLLRESALTACLLYVCAQGLAKVALFLCCGGLVNKHGSLSVEDLHGQAKRDIGLAIVFALASFAVAGLPLFVSAWADDLFDTSAVEAHAPWLCALPFVASAFTGAALCKAFARVFLGLGTRCVDDAQGEQGGEEKVDWPTMGAPTHAVIVGFVCVALASVVGFLDASPAQDAAHALLQPSSAQAVLVEGARDVVHTKLEPRAWSHEIVEVVAVVVAIALGAAFARWPRPRWLRIPIELMERWHSGDVRDDVTWLLVGLAVVLAALLFGLVR